MVDEEPDVEGVVKDLEAMGAPRIAFGDGTNVMKAAPKIHREMDAAVFRRSITGRPQFIETWVLREVAHFRPARDRHHAGVRNDLSRADLEQRRLAGAVGADEPDALALLHVQVQPVEEEALAEGLFEV